MDAPHRVKLFHYAQQRLLKRFDGAGDSWSKEQLMTLWQTVFPDREYVQGTEEFETVRACKPATRLPQHQPSLSPAQRKRQTNSTQPHSKSR